MIKMGKICEGCKDEMEMCFYYQNKKDCIKFGVAKDDGVCEFNELSKENKCYDPKY